MPKFVMIKRRDGEEVPINPDAVDYVRRIGQTTTISLGSGASFRVSATVAEVLEALEATGGERRVVEGERHPGGIETTPSATTPQASVSGPGAGNEAAQTPSGGSAGQPGEDDDAHDPDAHAQQEQMAAHDDGERRRVERREERRDERREERRDERRGLGLGRR